LSVIRIIVTQTKNVNEFEIFENVGIVTRSSALDFWCDMGEKNKKII